ncbi:hypothetical protein FSARC_3403 [Fusarium sarcochroum]|uniref:Glycylpeptide N-tetradecanoyltransferase n=1 Tax=Fusarium sarcochroum TaxID=1208366 RepID=A0A8H4U4A8_9HYPO|nr:hypothetical protein FSARC_3403 [Fusarium sarcochroum]
MASYKFWKTQPVSQFNSTNGVTDGPIRLIEPEDIPPEPEKLLPGYEWATLDLDNETHLDEVFHLLADHYVEDDDNDFRFLYAKDLLKYVLQPPGWIKNWHVGIRSSESQELVACICGIPSTVTIRRKELQVSVIDYLCIHTSLRRRRLTPVLIREITRRCYQDGVFQAVYTSATVLPKPVTTARYFHRTLNWLKLHDVGFVNLSLDSTKDAEIERMALPAEPSLAGMRPLKIEDIPCVHGLLSRYLKRFDLALSPTQEEVQHWLLGTANSPADEILWTYVVEDPDTLAITDFVSFFFVETLVLKNPKHRSIKVAYLNYYASEAGFSRKPADLKERLVLLINDALIFAKSNGADVFDALTTYHNHLFFDELKFQQGYGELHFYLFNYQTPPIPGDANYMRLATNRDKGGVGLIVT